MTDESIDLDRAANSEPRSASPRPLILNFGVPILRADASTAGPETRITKVEQETTDDD
jgi:hypothetical protein